MKTTIFIFFFVASSVWSEISRSVVSSAGSTFTGNGLSLSWTVGEFVSGTLTKETVLTQGFQQGDLFDISPIGKGRAFSEIKVFPNPTYGAITVQLDNRKGNYFYQLFDATGRSLSEKFELSRTLFSKLDLSEYTGGNYFLRVFSGESEEVKIFKIVKKR